MTLFSEWTNERSVASLGTNAGSAPIAFQRWHKFKEAFAPELVLRALTEEPRDIRLCLDPFGGSGTTALAAQLMGVGSTTVEVNPFLVDVIKAKLTPLDADELSYALGAVCGARNRRTTDARRYFRNLPPTFIESSQGERWLFNASIATRIAKTLSAIDEVADFDQRNFFRVVLSGLLTAVSNVTVNGKGRRYRRNWRDRALEPSDVDRLFASRCQEAIQDMHRFSERPSVPTYVMHADARQFRTSRVHDIAIFSPPYPNSFDYTDVYNIELWMLGYLTSGKDNRSLRNSTLSSHVQLHRDFVRAPEGAPTLTKALAALEDVRANLWSRWIPSMVGAYFTDLLKVLARVRKVLRDGAACWMIVGDSRYGGIHVPTGDILTELAAQAGWSVESADRIRSMRSSSQHGGVDELAESLLILRRA